MEEARREQMWARRWLAAAAIATAALALASNGAYHDDDLKHYLFARWTRRDTEYLAHVWGRPGFTLLYALPAQLGWTACRLLSVALSAATAWATFRSAQRLGLGRANWAVPLVYAQPLFLHLSFTTLTETPAALYLALATWAALAGRARTSAAVFSLVLFTRHEAAILLPVWAWAVARGGVRRNLGAILLLAWAPVAYNIVSRLAFGFWPAAVFTSPAGATHYGEGTPATFVFRFVVMAGPVVAPLFLVGAAVLWKDPRARPLIVGAALFVAAQTALYMRQAYATGGYARFLVPLAPWVTLGALAAIHALARNPSRKARLGWMIAGAALLACAEYENAANPIPAVAAHWWLVRAAGLLVLAAIAARFVPRLRAVGTVVIVASLVGPLAGRAAWPHRLRPRERDIAGAVAWLSGNVPSFDGRPLLSMNDWTHYFADRWYAARRPPFHEELETARPGAIFLWEARYAPSPDANIQLEPLLGDRRWREIHASPADETGRSFVHVFERAGRE